MIRTIADLLETIRREETKLLDEQNIKHGPMIGDMYEGLTREILENTVFEDLDLRVTNGLISNSSGDYTNQIDCMLVQGEGKKLPYADHFIYNIEQVVAVIEV